MKQLSSKRWTRFLLIFLFMLSSSACQSDTVGTPIATEAPEAESVEADVVFGPGAFIYPDPTAGLADLSSYKATLTLNFEGTQDGQPSQWSKTYVMLSTKDPAARQLTIARTENLVEFSPIFMAEVDGAAYERNGESACTANVLDPENSLIGRLEPAGLLNGMIGAEEAGGETVNDVAANHYTFDERAFGQLGLAQSTGEMWVASDGGYIIKYLLTTKGNADYFGEGIEGTLTWDYELTDINGSITFALPADCPAGMVDAPLLPDASNILNLPSILTYDTTSSVAAAAAFYQEQLPSLGWTLVGESTITETNALIQFIQGDQNLTVIITTDTGVTKITILLEKVQE